MAGSLNARRAAIAIFASAVAWIFTDGGAVVRAEDPRSALATNAEEKPGKQSQVDYGFFHPDPNHVWNRLHRALFVRTSSDGRAWGMDRVDPLLWPESTHLLTGDGHRRALGALNEFLAGTSDRNIEDPLNRALLHSSLWAVFDWSAAPRVESSHRDARHALQVRLAKAMQRLSLSDEEIQKLPDNYAAAVASKEFAAQFDPEHSEQPFLPPDLFQDSGPWVMIASNELAAPVHTEFASGRSMFLVFLRLPAGRQTTLDYLEDLRKFPKPLIINPRYGIGPNTEPTPVSLNPDLPQLPAGTQAALVRQMMTIDQSGQLQPTRLTQMVQLRVYGSQRDQNAEDTRNSHVFFEFGLSAKKLFAGKVGGLRVVERDERDFVQFQSHTNDQLDLPQTLVMHQCAGCHREPGIFSLHSYTRAFGPQTNRPVLLNKTDADYQELLTRLFKRRRYDWGLLDGLRDRERP